MTKKVGGVNIAVISQEFAITAAAIHDIRIEFATQFGTGLGQNTREVVAAVKCITKSRQITRADLVLAENTFLHGKEIITSYGGYKERSRFTRGAFVDKILYKVEHLTGFAADRLEECDIIWPVIGVIVMITAAILFYAVAEQVEKLIIPCHGEETV